MRDDIAELTRLNEEIATVENAVDLGRLDEILATELAFQRRDGTIVDRKTFLATLKAGSRVVEVESVHLYGDRAVVTCVVTDSGPSIHNIRLFVRVGTEWKLLGWANQAL